MTQLDLPAESLASHSFSILSFFPIITVLPLGTVGNLCFFSEPLLLITKGIDKSICWKITNNLFPLRISFHSIHIVCFWLPAWFLNREGIYSSIRQILLRLSYVPDNVLCISLSLCWVFCTVLPGNCVHSMGSIFPERPVFSTCSIDGSPFIRGKNHFQPRVYDENRMSHFPKTLTAWHVQCIPLNKLLETLSNVNYYFFISKRHLS